MMLGKIYRNREHISFPEYTVNSPHLKYFRGGAPSGDWRLVAVAAVVAAAVAAGAETD